MAVDISFHFVCVLGDSGFVEFVVSIKYQTVMYERYLGDFIKVLRIASPISGFIST